MSANLEDQLGAAQLDADYKQRFRTSVIVGGATHTHVPNEGAVLANMIDRELEKLKREAPAPAPAEQPDSGEIGAIEYLIARESAAAQLDFQAHEAAKPRIKRY